MSNINLTTNIEEKKLAPLPMINGGLLAITLFFLLTAVSWVGITIYNKNVKSQIDAVKSQYDKSYNSIVSNNKARDVADFQNRTDQVKKMLDGDSGGNTVQNLGIIEKIILPSVYLDSYAYDKQNGQITLRCVTDNYNNVAKQILSFKTFKDENNFSYFSVAKAGETTLNQEIGKVNFPIVLKINKK